MQLLHRQECDVAQTEEPVYRREHISDPLRVENIPQPNDVKIDAQVDKPFGGGWADFAWFDDVEG